MGEHLRRAEGANVMFIDRVDAGRQLARRLGHLRGPDLVVLGLPRGGVVVAFQVAEALSAPLDVIVVRKLGVPTQPELAMGAIGEGGVRIISPEITRIARVDAAQLAAVEATELAALEQRTRLFRGGQAAAPLGGRTALIVDDGVATGATARAACQVARAHGAARVVLAVPVAAKDAVTALRADADDVICVLTPTQLWSVGQWYEQFAATTDAEVRDLLARAAGRTTTATPAPPGANRPVGRLRLPGRITLPVGTRGTPTRRRTGRPDRRGRDGP
jgi:putative phosphoribosyl transferase